MSMTQAQVVALMESSQNETEWNNNCDVVQKEFGGYPRFWWEAIMMSGLAHRVQQSWMASAVKGNLKEITPEGDGSVVVMELLPPSPEEIAEIRRQQAV